VEFVGNSKLSTNKNPKTKTKSEKQNQKNKIRKTKSEKQNQKNKSEKQIRNQNTESLTQKQKTNMSKTTTAKQQSKSATTKSQFIKDIDNQDLVEEIMKRGIDPNKIAQSDATTKPGKTENTAAQPVNENKAEAPKFRLNGQESKHLVEYETVIKDHLQGFYPFGRALRSINNEKLYKDHGTFEKYCPEKWDLDDGYAYRLIESADVMDKVSPIGGVLPVNEAQVRPLTQLKANQWVAAWKMVIEDANGNRVTAKMVQAVVDEKLGGKGEAAKSKAKAAKGSGSTVKQVITWLNAARKELKANNTKAVEKLLTQIEKALEGIK